MSSSARSPSRAAARVSAKITGWPSTSRCAARAAAAVSAEKLGGPAAARLVSMPAELTEELEQYNIMHNFPQPLSHYSSIKSPAAERAGVTLSRAMTLVASGPRRRRPGWQRFSTGGVDKGVRNAGAPVVKGGD